MKQQFVIDFKIILRFAWLSGTLLLFLSVLRWYGFAVWSIKDIISLISSVRWDHLSAVVVIFIALLFKRQVGDLLNRFRSGKFGKSGFETSFDPYTKANQEQDLEAENNSDRLTIADVRELMNKVPKIDSTKIKEEASVSHSWLLRNGIRTRSRLLDLVESVAIFDFLAQVDVDELHRPESNPLDTVAVATWGATLFTFGLRDDVKEYIVNQIRQSPEYQRIHENSVS